MDAVICVVLAFCAFLWISHLESLFPERFYVIRNIWFGADHFRVLSNMTNQEVSHWRTHVHPLFSLLAHPPAKALMALGLSPLAAANIVLSASGAAAVTLTYLTAKAIGLAVGDALLVALSFVASAAFTFWFALVETFPMGATTLSAMLLIAALRPSSTLVWIAGSAATLSITTTNWALGLLTTYFGNNRRRFVMISASALVIVGGLSFVQKAYFPTARLFFLPGIVAEETAWLAVKKFDASALGVIGTRIANIWLYPGVAPLPEPSSPLKSDGINVDTILSHPTLGLRSLSPAGIIGIVGWLLMLASGISACMGHRERAHLSMPLLLFLAFQTLLHGVWGDEPFLYSAHFLPAMITVCAFGLKGPHAGITRLAMIAFIGAASFANYPTFRDSIGFVERTLGLR